MGLGDMMRTSASGMDAQANRLSAVSDNIANPNTIGYKRASTEFSSLLVDSSTVDYAPGSVETVVRHAISQQGTLQHSASQTDLAVEGNGFFVVTDASGAFYLTRAGSFVVDGGGDLINAGGFYLMGYPLTGGQNSSPVVNGYTGLERVNFSDLSLKASPSRVGTFQANLPASESIVPPANLPSANNATASVTQKSSLVVYNYLGGQVVLDIYLSKTADNTWEMSVFNRADLPANGSFPYNNPPLATQTVNFDPTTGGIVTGGTSSITVPIPGGAPFTMDFSLLTQLSSPYAVISASADGNAPIGVKSVEITQDGTVYTSYPNGARISAYKIPLAAVPGTNFLSPLSGEVFQPNQNSGDIRIGFAQTGTFGSILSNTLEQSNVDMADELTTLIDAQGGYRANSKVFQSAADMLDVLINLKR